METYNQVEAPANELMRSTMLGVEQRSKSLSSNVKSMYGNSKHLWMWDYKSLEFELKKAGFTNIRPCQFGDSADNMFGFVEEQSRFYNAAAFECQK